TIVQLDGNVETVNGGAPVATIGSCPDYTITYTNQVFATLTMTITPSMLALPEGPGGIVPNAGDADPFGGDDGNDGIIADAGDAGDDDAQYATAGYDDNDY
ncbi:hypothetical protein H4R18_004868, partial [Coemansia javaensis]